MLSYCPNQDVTSITKQNSWMKGKTGLKTKKSRFSEPQQVKTARYNLPFYGKVLMLK